MKSHSDGSVYLAVEAVQLLEALFILLILLAQSATEIVQPYALESHFVLQFRVLKHRLFVPLRECRKGILLVRYIHLVLQHRVATNT